MSTIPPWHQLQTERPLPGKRSGDASRVSLLELEVTVEVCSFRGRHAFAQDADGVASDDLSVLQKHPIRKLGRRKRNWFVELQVGNIDGFVADFAVQELAVVGEV